MSDTILTRFYRSSNAVSGHQQNQTGPRIGTVLWVCPEVHMSPSKPLLDLPVGLLGRGRPLVVLVNPEGSGSGIWDEATGTPGFFTFFFLLVLVTTKRDPSGTHQDMTDSESGPEWF